MYVREYNGITTIMHLINYDERALARDETLVVWCVRFMTDVYEEVNITKLIVVYLYHVGINSAHMDALLFCALQENKMQSQR